MYLFDLHCDTVVEICREKLGLANNTTQLSIDRLAQDTCWCQCYAIFMPDEYRGQAAIDYFQRHHGYFLRQMEKYQKQICQVVSVKELDKAYACGKFAAMLTVEGGSVLAGDLSRIELLSKLGVKMMTLTWNGENEIGSGNSTDHGLTPFGEEVIPEMERNRIVIDVSHLNEAGFWQAAKIAKYPMAASHSNCRAVWDHPRNLRDDQIRYIIQTGGIVGLNFYIGFINGQQNPKPQDLLKHVEHFLELGGENTLALGSDYDGADMPAWLDSVEKVQQLYRLMAFEFGRATTDKIFYDNAYHFFEKYEEAVG